MAVAPSLSSAVSLGMWMRIKTNKRPPEGRGEAVTVCRSRWRPGGDGQSRRGGGGGGASVRMVVLDKTGVRKETTTTTTIYSKEHDLVLYVDGVVEVERVACVCLAIRHEPWGSPFFYCVGGEQQAGGPAGRRAGCEIPRRIQRNNRHSKKTVHSCDFSYVCIICTPNARSRCLSIPWTRTPSISPKIAVPQRLIC